MGRNRTGGKTFRCESGEPLHVDLVHVDALLMEMLLFSFSSQQTGSKAMRV